MSCFGLNLKWSNNYIGAENFDETAHMDSISQIITNITKGCSLNDLRPLFIDTKSFRNDITSFVHSESGLNILQFAILHRRYDIVQYLLDVFKLTALEQSCLVDCKVVDNHPLLLACFVGSIRLIKYLHKKGSDWMITGRVSLCVPHLEILYQATRCPYELCIEQGHVSCADYILASISMTCKMYYNQKLHNSCTIGHPKHIKYHVDQSPIHLINSQNVDGQSPIMMLCKNIDEIRIVAVMSEFIMKPDTVNDELYFCERRHEEPWLPLSGIPGCSCFYTNQIFVYLAAHGADLNATNHNINSALDFLAYELGQLWPNREWNDKLEYSFLEQCIPKAANTALQSHGDTVGRFHSIMSAMRCLLLLGAETFVLDSNQRFDHSVLHTLLHTCSWPISNGLCILTPELCKIIELLLQFGADPMIPSKNNRLSSFDMLLSMSLEEIPKRHALDIVHLFMKYGANPDECVDDPKAIHSSIVVDGWRKLYPVMRVLERRRNLDVAQLLLNFMTIPSIQHALRQIELTALFEPFVWKPDCYAAADKEYHDKWKECCKIKLRTLKHCCKIVIIKSMGHKIVNVQTLPLPNKLKEYVEDKQC